MSTSLHKFNKFIKSIHLALMLLLPLSVLSAQNQLTLQSAWSITLKNNYTIQQQETLIKKAREEISIQKTDYYPSLSTSGLIARANFDKLPINIPNASGKVGIDLVSLSINQSIFSGFSTKNQVKSASEKLALQEIQKQLIHNTVLFEVGNLFYDIQFNLLQQNVLKASANRIDNQLTRIRNLYLSQQATPFDTLEIANRKLQVENQSAILEDTYAILMSNMSYLLNEDELLSVKPLSLRSLDFSLEDIQSYNQLAMQWRPEFGSIQSQKRVQLFYSDILRARYYPQLSASVAFNLMKPTGDILNNEWTNFYSVLVNFQWELWNWKRDSKKVQQVSLDLQRLELQEIQLVKDIRHQIKVAYQYLQSSKKKIKLQQNLVDQENERYRITEERYNQGLATFLDLNTAELALTEAEAELHKNYIDWHKNMLRLEFATGNIRQKHEEVTND